MRAARPARSSTKSWNRAIAGSSTTERQWIVAGGEKSRHQPLSTSHRLLNVMHHLVYLRGGIAVHQLEAAAELLIIRHLILAAVIGHKKVVRLEASQRLVQRLPAPQRVDHVDIAPRTEPVPYMQSVGEICHVVVSQAVNRVISTSLLVEPLVRRIGWQIARQISVPRFLSHRRQ